MRKIIGDNIVEPFVSEYNSLILLVPKKHLPDSDRKRWRLVVDYRAINKKLIVDKYHYHVWMTFWKKFLEETQETLLPSLLKRDPFSLKDYHTYTHNCSLQPY